MNPPSKNILESHLPYYFNHIPKTAGTTIKEWLWDNSPGSIYDNLPCKTKYGRMARTNAHCNSIPKDLLSFCVIRDPVDRAISTYNMRNRKNKFCNPNHADFWIKRMVRYGDIDRHEIPQSKYKCKKKLCFDNLGKEFAELVNKNGGNFKGFDSLKDYGSSNHYGKCRKDDLNKETINYINKKYKDDLALYNEVCKKKK